MAGSTTSRELVVLGTASQAPTRDRNHNGYLLRWDRLGLLFDPGEGTQRQMLRADVRSSAISHILITHQHGDHCLGLPGVLHRMVIDQRSSPVTIVHPQEATDYVDQLLAIGLWDDTLTVVRVPVPQGGMSMPVGPGHSLMAVALDHRIATVGYRLQEESGIRVDPVALAATGLSGPIVGDLLRDGVVQVDGRVVHRDEISAAVAGQAMAFVMDTRVCAGATSLLRDVDLGVVESTFQDGHEDLADQWGHMTAAQAARMAAQAGVRRLVLTHFSRRYPVAETFADQARPFHRDVIAAVDLMRIPVPSRAPVRVAPEQVQR